MCLSYHGCPPFIRLSCQRHVLQPRAFAASALAYHIAYRPYARPSPTPSSTDPMPAGIGSVGDCVGEGHLARKLEAPDGQNTGGAHTRNPSPYSTCRWFGPTEGEKRWERQRQVLHANARRHT